MSEFAPLFEELRGIMLPYAEQLVCTVDDHNELSLDTRHLMKNKKPLWFGGVQIKKRYVSYHLMPVYVNPKLLDGLSPELKKRMQGKSCFNFRKSEASLVEELSAFTKAGFEDYRTQGFV
ncbi:MAG: hypothetical protein WED11_12135 [Natronospirillum sp.]